MGCEQTGQFAAELALGIADGAERARALDHLADCGECRRAVADLSEVVDDLLLLAPEHEPPVGLESRVLARMDLAEKPGKRRLVPRLAQWIAAPVAAAAVTAAVLVSVYHDDHVTATNYRATLEQANGQSFQAHRLRDAAGAAAGVAFGYQGSPSWILVTVDRSHAREIDLRLAIVGER